jgi:hypothetical protein
MDWTGKTATAQVIRGFVKSTPVVEQCALPRCISRLVIAPKYAPGQMKEDPDHGFRVCVNALINKCLKPYASTVPLATDEINKTVWIQLLPPSRRFQCLLVHTQFHVKRTKGSPPSTRRTESTAGTG